MKPWMTDNEISAITSRLYREASMFEWGAGGSTMAFAPLVKTYESVESDGGWFGKVQAVAADNVSIEHVPSDKPRSFPMVKRDEFKTYVERIKQKGIYDFILIDGRARIFCAIEAYDHIHEKSLVFLHDWDRTPYHFVLEWYDLVEVVDKLAILRKKT